METTNLLKKIEITHIFDKFLIVSGIVTSARFCSSLRPNHFIRITRIFRTKVFLSDGKTVCTKQSDIRTFFSDVRNIFWMNIQFCPSESISTSCKCNLVLVFTLLYKYIDQNNMNLIDIYYILYIVRLQIICDN